MSYVSLNGGDKFIYTEEDMKWLKETHLPDLDLGHKKSAMIYGNEDCPYLIEVFAVRVPRIYDMGIKYVLVTHD